MLSATILGVLFAPIFFVFVMKIFGTHKRLGNKASVAGAPMSSHPAE